MTARDPMRWVREGTRVRIYSAAAGFRDALAEGKVVAYSIAPQICVEDATGEKTWWRVDLPINVLEEHS